MQLDEVMVGTPIVAAHALASQNEFVSYLYMTKVIKEKKTINFTGHKNVKKPDQWAKHSATEDLIFADSPELHVYIV